MSGNSTAGGYVDRGGISGDVGTQISLTNFTVSTHRSRHNSPRVRIESILRPADSENFRSETTT